MIAPTSLTGSLPRVATFRVNTIHPSLNAWSRKHPMAVATWKIEYGQWVAIAIHEAVQAGTWDGQVFDQADVTLIHHFTPGHRHDADNVTPKFFLDSLVARGVLVDDDFDHMDLHLLNGTRSRPPWTEIRVTERKEKGEASC